MVSGLPVARHHAFETALDVLNAALERVPGNRDLLVALATMSRDAGKLDEARVHAAALAELDPQDAVAGALLRELGQ